MAPEIQGLLAGREVFLRAVATCLDFPCNLRHSQNQRTYRQGLITLGKHKEVSEEVSWGIPEIFTDLSTILLLFTEVTVPLT